MLDREPFLKAIFAAPDDDLPRLAFADWLEERGDPDWAELIRIQCDLARGDAADPAWLRDRERALRVAVWDDRAGEVVRGFRPVATLETTAELLADPEAFRLAAACGRPEWYGATRLKVVGGPVVVPAPLATILTSPVTEKLADLDLSGREVPAPADEDDPPPPGVLADYDLQPTINTAMVEELAGMRECRRLTALDLRNNDLGNDAVRALAESNYFTRLRRLRVSEGNRFRGRVWQLLLERFGEDVVD